jgi:hypothetical protein
MMLKGASSHLAHIFLKICVSYCSFISKMPVSENEHHLYIFGVLDKLFNVSLHFFINKKRIKASTSQIYQDFFSFGARD